MRNAFLLLILAVSLFGQRIPGAYIIEFEGEPAIESVIREKKRIGDMDKDMAVRRARVRESARGFHRAIEARGLRMTREFDTLLSGAVVTGLSDAQAEALRRMPGVKRLVEDRMEKTHLDRAVKLHKIDEAWTALPAGPDSAGEGIRIGIVDTGIDVTHPAFKDPGLPVLDGFPRVTAARDRDSANGKLIVLRSYPSTAGVREQEVHGTAVAMTAAGGRVEGPFGQFSGIAPKAYLGVYNVNGGSGISASNILSALEDAVADGMDVINLSIGGPQLSIGGSFIDALERVTRAGVIFVTAAGNYGGPHSVTWEGDALGVLSAGATTNDRTIVEGAITVDGGPTILAIPGDASVGKPAVSGVLRDAAAAGTGNELGCSSFPANSLRDAIALIKRGDCNFELKIDNAEAAGAIGVIIFNQTQTTDRFRMVLGAAKLPTVWINNDRGEELKSLISEGDKSASLNASGIVPFSQSADQVASFSSRGPVASGAIKPDLTATGADLMTGAPSYLGPESASYWLYLGAGYGLWDGTSFSSPLIAGAAAVLKQARPGLTAPQYRSLLVNSSTKVTDPAGKTAGVNEVGGGRLNLANALRLPLSAEPLSLSFGGGRGDVDQTKTIKFTNLSGVDDTFSVVVDKLGGDAEPMASETSFSLDAGQSRDLSISLKGSGLAAGPLEGWLVLKGNKSDSEIRVPYWYGVRGTEPKAVSVVYESSGGPGQLLRPGFIVRVLDAAGLPIDGITPTVTVESGRATIQGIEPIGDIAGTWAVNVRLSTAATNGVIFRVTAGDVSALAIVIVE